MGNTASEVSSGVKDQANASSRDLYKLVNLADGGELIKMMKEALRNKDFTEIDEKIKTELPKFLYNAGEGKRMPLKEIYAKYNLKVAGNLQKRKKNNYDEEKELTGIPVPGLEPDKEVCWDLDQRGGVGETIVHVCLLMGSHVANEVAKRLIMYFPKIVNDTYFANDYYGENALHMAVVNENPVMVKYLLDHGVNVHQRCVGTFFTADDQKAARRFASEHEWVDLPLRTNYKGHTYWGEFPLNFAACLSQEECFRLLIAKKANPNVQDSNGNTVLHIMVIHENPDMLDLAYQLKAKLHIRNNQGLTPLTLAAQLAKAEMYNHILDIEREVYWTYGDVTCAAYPLQYTDSINPTNGEINRTSALALTVYGASDEHLDLFEGLLENMLMEKWKVFARKMLYQHLGLFAAYFLIYLIAWCLRPSKQTADFEKALKFYNGSFEQASEHLLNISASACYLLEIDTNLEYVRTLLELLTVGGAAAYLGLAMWQMHNVGYNLYWESLFGFPAKIIFLISCALVLFMVPLRFACVYEVEDNVGIIATLLTSCHFLFFCRGFKLVGTLVLMIYKMVAGDLLRFFLIYMVFLIGFSQSFYIIFLGYDRPDANNVKEESIFRNFHESFNRLFIMSIGEFGRFWEDLKFCTLHRLGEIMFILYILLVTVLLINLLIAMMGNTYERIVETKKEYVRQWAAIILMMEQSLTPQQRLAAQVQYSRPMSGDKKARALITRWRHSDQERAKHLEERDAAREAFIEHKAAQLRRLMSGLPLHAHRKGTKAGQGEQQDRVNNVLKVLAT